MQVAGRHYRTVTMQRGIVRMINQPALPYRLELVDLPTHRETAEAIRSMVVRGAGAIGACGGFGVAQAALEAPEGEGFWPYVERAVETLRHTRPTAQDLFHAIDGVLAAARSAPGIAEARAAAVAQAQAWADANAAAGEAIGRVGAALIADGARILTHCNAGWLAFVDWGSALAPIYCAARQGKQVLVYVDETRPRSQGARLTAWELAGEGIPHHVIADNAAGYLMQQGLVDLVIVGADRIAANGDVANKIGTYEKALCAADNQVPFYVAAPWSTFDPACPSGAHIPIEERSEDEVLWVTGEDGQGRPARVQHSHAGARALNPAFDVTPARLIRGIITEEGIFAPGAMAEAQPRQI
ncbi:MAG: S-methyl-5-thioribose-1-phosphate isomerase [Anaerolineae bacterium]|jgi:methylthioribose-1-phosphate isomerase|nr:S-methyl-5-thioribose-1-phosphate isomerase [Chloroflexota bacterium]